MYFRIRTVDGKVKVINIASRLSTIKDVKLEIEKELFIKADEFKYIYLGKILQDEYTLHDYKIKLNDIIQLIPIISNSESKPTTSKNSTTEEKEITKDKVEEKVQETEDVKEELVNSLYYKIGEAVDYYYQCNGAWYETTLQNIVKKKEEILYIVEFSDVPVTELFIRPRSRRLIPFDELFIGQKVMINYNLEEPKEIGLWYDFTIFKLNKKRTFQELSGLLHISSENQLEVQIVNPKEGIYAIETPKLLTERTIADEDFMADTSKCRSIPPYCASCKDIPSKNCKDCGCNICGGKQDENKLLLCDECDYAYHLTCLEPPLEVIPEGDWYCPECKNDENEIVKAGDKLKKSKKKSSTQANKEPKRDWGRGMACVGRTKICDIVLPYHRGKIPGVEVGMSWFFRIQVSEAGVHRPHVAGIHGRETDCAYSIVLSGGYEDDVDNGDEFMYTGSGGRDLSGNKRTAAQSSDQILTRMNKALALNCNAPLNAKNGATAKNWKEGIPVRVVRNYKLAKHSKYAPKKGNRYDGLYKVVKYYPTKGESGFRVWRYLLRRDDPDPAPWTKKGKERMAKLGLKMIYPDGYTEAMKTNDKKRSRSDEENATASKENMSPSSKKLKLEQEAYVLDDELKSLIESDEQNAKLWVECSETLRDGKLAFLQCVSERFKCAFCLEMVNHPVTTPCAHNFCLKCLQQSFLTWQEVCPKCRYRIGETFKMNVNETLKSVLSLLYPVYKSDN
nr:PREDICTED: E3 ubiquitin-protein ligase UHRF1-like [Linepithema humile]